MEAENATRSLDILSKKNVLWSFSPYFLPPPPPTPTPTLTPILFFCIHHLPQTCLSPESSINIP